MTIVDKSVVPLEFAGWAQGNSSTAQGNSSKKMMSSVFNKLPFFFYL